MALNLTMLALRGIVEGFWSFVAQKGYWILRTSRSWKIEMLRRGSDNWRLGLWSFKGKQTPSEPFVWYLGLRICRSKTFFFFSGTTEASYQGLENQLWLTIDSLIQHSQGLSAFNRDEAPELRGGSRHCSPPLNEEAICSWHLLQRKISFLH